MKRRPEGEPEQKRCARLPLRQLTSDPRLAAAAVSHFPLTSDGVAAMAAVKARTNRRWKTREEEDGCVWKVLFLAALTSVRSLVFISGFNLSGLSRKTLYLTI